MKRVTQITKLREVSNYIEAKSPTNFFLADINLTEKEQYKSQPILNLQYYDKYSLLSKKN